VLADRPKRKSASAELGDETPGGVDGVPLIARGSRFIAVVHHDDVAVGHARRNALERAFGVARSTIG